ncbi:hypothetical protein JCGZ_20014 [Jatropha curcas]|uniref:Uncharacterized protein n=1 Tax=Jatropha curcas TaxID=180498 RepID=A0A067K6M8_JATCU|nr:hypothetical protein JCGZ_20014 [Jatropha curcas]
MCLQSALESWLSIWACEHRVLPMLRLHGFNANTSVKSLPPSMEVQLKIMKYPWGDMADYPDSILSAIVYQQSNNSMANARVEALNSRSPDTAIVVGKPEDGLGASFSFILDRTAQTAQGILETHLVSPYPMSPPGYTHHISSLLWRGTPMSTYLASMVPPEGRGRGAQYGGHASR